MISKIKGWIFGKVIFTKVLGKFAKHGAGVLVALLFSDKIPFVKAALAAMELTPGQVEAGAVVVLTGIFGAVWNFIEHRAKP